MDYVLDSQVIMKRTKIPYVIKYKFVPIQHTVKYGNKTCTYKTSFHFQYSPQERACAERDEGLEALWKQLEIPGF